MTVIRPIIPYAAKTRTGTSETCFLLETCEIKILKANANKTLVEQNRIESIRKALKIGYISISISNRKNNRMIKWKSSDITQYMGLFTQFLVFKRFLEFMI